MAEGAPTKPGQPDRSKGGGRPSMALDRRPVTPEARALVARLLGMVEDREKRLGERRRGRRATAREGLVDVAGLFAGELVAAVDGDF